MQFVLLASALWITQVQLISLLCGELCYIIARLSGGHAWKLQSSRALFPTKSPNGFTGSYSGLYISFTDVVILVERNQWHTVGAIIIWSLADFVGLPNYKEWNCVQF